MFFKKVKKADLEAVSSRNADQERQENKMMRAWISVWGCHYIVNSFILCLY